VGEKKAAFLLDTEV